MAGASLELQGLLNAVFSAWAPLTSLLGEGGIYDRAPATAAFPHVEIGEAEEHADLADCIDGSEHFLTVHIWTRDGETLGKVLAKRIGAELAAAIRARAETEEDLPSHRLLVIERESTRYFDDQDGLSVHGVVTFRALTEPLS